jgi:hypothetical protein
MIIKTSLGCLHTPVHGLVLYFFSIIKLLPLIQELVFPIQMLLRDFSFDDHMLPIVCLSQLILFFFIFIFILLSFNLLFLLFKVKRSGRFILLIVLLLNLLLDIFLLYLHFNLSFVLFQKLSQIAHFFIF